MLIKKMSENENLMNPLKIQVILAGGLAEESRNALSLLAAGFHELGHVVTVTRSYTRMELKPPTQNDSLTGFYLVTGL